MIEADIRVDAKDFLLGHTLRNAPRISASFSRVVFANEIFPQWVKIADGTSERIETLLDEDGSVSSFEFMRDSGDEAVIRIDWSADDVPTILNALQEHEMTLIEAVGTQTQWKLRLWLESVDILSSANGYCDENGISFSLDSLENLEGGQTEREFLTEAQREAFELAYEKGYFDIPQKCSLDEIATELDISPQAMSDRLRRGNRRLVRAVLEQQFAGSNAR